MEPETVHLHTLAGMVRLLLLTVRFDRYHVIVSGRRVQTETTLRLLRRRGLKPGHTLFELIVKRPAPVGPGKVLLRLRLFHIRLPRIGSRLWP